MDSKLKLLFLCSGNSCRSKMAEAWAQVLLPQFDVYSAGMFPHELNPYALAAMKEKDITLSSKTQDVNDLNSLNFDHVIIVCDKSSKNCQVDFQGANVIHQNFTGPSKLARTKNTEEEKMDCFRLVRDEIHEFIKTLPDSLSTSTSK